MNEMVYLAFLSGVGLPEILVVLVVVLVLYGPRRLPEIARQVGKVIGDLRRASDDFRDQVMRADQEPPPGETEKPLIEISAPDVSSSLPEGSTPADTSSGGKSQPASPSNTTGEGSDLAG